MPIRRPKLNQDPDISLKLSELEIDADKNWEGRGLRNVKEIAQNALYGDMPVRSRNTLMNLPPGFQGFLLVSAGPRNMPVWAPFSTDWVKYIGVTPYSSHAEAIVPLDHVAVDDAEADTVLDTSNVPTLYNSALLDLAVVGLVALNHNESESLTLQTELTHVLV